MTATKHAALMRQVAAMRVEVEANKRVPAAIRKTDEAAVAYVLHWFTTYDAALEDAAIRLGDGAALLAIRASIYAAIALAYPGLAFECGRQLARRAG